MSLDWDVSKIDNYQEVTTKIVDGKKKWADETNTLVWGTICGVGLHSITEKNVEEWIFRVRFLKELGSTGWSSSTKTTTSSVIGLTTKISAAISV